MKICVKINNYNNFILVFFIHDILVLQINIDAKLFQYNDYNIIKYINNIIISHFIFIYRKNIFFIKILSEKKYEYIEKIIYKIFNISPKYFLDDIYKYKKNINFFDTVNTNIVGIFLSSRYHFPNRTLIILDINNINTLIIIKDHKIIEYIILNTVNNYIITNIYLKDMYLKKEKEFNNKNEILIFFLSFFQKKYPDMLLIRTGKKEKRIHKNSIFIAHLALHGILISED